MSLRAGTATVNITPPIGVWLAGYGHRMKPSSSVHSELLAQALVVEAGGQKAAIVGADLIGVDQELLSRVQKLVLDWTGIAPDHLLVNASHVHAGPSVVSKLLWPWLEADAAYCDVLVRKLATAVKLANDRLQTATASFGTDEMAIGVNRRLRRPDGSVVFGENIAGPIDPTISALRFDDSNEKPLAVLFSCACHPVIFNDLSVSSDYVGYARQTVERGMGGSTTALFLQGCGADINPRGMNTEDKAGLAQRLGTKLGLAAINAAASAAPLKLPPIAARSAEVALPLESPPSVREAKRLLRQERAKLQEAEAAHDVKLANYGQVMVAWAERLVACATEGAKERTQPISIQAIRLGDLAILGLGGEVLTGIGAGIKRRSPFPNTLVLGYSNGLIGYVPPASAYAEGGYEVRTAIRWYGGTLMLAQETEQVLTEAAARMLNEMKSISQA